MNGFGPEGGGSLADCIKSNGTLQELNVSGNRLNTPNAFAIAQALAVNTTLQVLKVKSSDDKKCLDYFYFIWILF